MRASTHTRDRNVRQALDVTSSRQLCAGYGWRESEFAIARAVGFPVLRSDGAGSWRCSRVHVRAWWAALTAAVPRNLPVDLILGSSSVMQISDIVAAFGWTPDLFELACEHLNFPRRHIEERIGDDGHRRTEVYCLAHEVSEWMERARLIRFHEKGEI